MNNYKEKPIVSTTEASPYGTRDYLYPIYLYILPIVPYKKKTRAYAISLITLIIFVFLVTTAFVAIVSLLYRLIVSTTMQN